MTIFLKFINLLRRRDRASRTWREINFQRNRANEAFLTPCCSVLRRARRGGKQVVTGEKKRIRGSRNRRRMTLLSRDEHVLGRRGRWGFRASRRLRGRRVGPSYPRAPMIPSGLFPADDSSSSSVIGASCIRACRAVTTIGRQFGSSASTRATYASENGSESSLGADQQRDSSTESVFWIRDGGRGAGAAWRVRD